MNRSLTVLLAAVLAACVAQFYLDHEALSEYLRQLTALRGDLPQQAKWAREGIERLKRKAEAFELESEQL
jgi:hypothetical protein